MDIGVLHPGEMGAAVAGALVDSGHRVVWNPEGRSEDTRTRAQRYGLEPVSTLDEMVRQCGMILSICPPHGAIDVARQIAATPTPFSGIYVDANAIAPTTAALVASIVAARGAHYVDGGILGSPPPSPSTRLCLSGPDVAVVAEVFSKTAIEIVQLGDDAMAASALKMAYATWSKGGSALLLAIRAMARHYNIEDALVDQWAQSQSELIGKVDAAAFAAMTKGWRWTGEMDEIASTFASAGLPDGFGRAASEIYRRVPRQDPVGDGEDVGRVIADLRGSQTE